MKRFSRVRVILLPLIGEQESQEVDGIAWTVLPGQIGVLHRRGEELLIRNVPERFLTPVTENYLFDQDLIALAAKKLQEEIYDRLRREGEYIDHQPVQDNEHISD